jgi:hypothetical protein
LGEPIFGSRGRSLFAFSFSRFVSPHSFFRFRIPMHRAFVVVLLGVAPIPLAAQDAEQKAVIAVVDRLFDGMKRADTAAMRALFVPQARMFGLGRDSQVTANTVDGWINSVGGRPAGQLIERTWAHEVRVDGHIAQAWMQYDFHVGERFSHCGVDAFNFVKVAGEWKIVSVMDTRRQTNCMPPSGRLP